MNFLAIDISHDDIHLFNIVNAERLEIQNLQKQIKNNMHWLKNNKDIRNMTP